MGVPALKSRIFKACLYAKRGTPAALSMSIQTGPRGGQYYINSNENQELILLLYLKYSGYVD
jgi:hypothetical protein